MRLKFLYPNGNTEVMDGTWVAGAGTLRSGDTLDWAVVRQGQRVLRKPLQYLIQIVVPEANWETRRVRLSTRGKDSLGIDPK